MNFSVGDIVQMKKQHPCGSNEWEVLRVGMDFRISAADADIWLCFRGLSLRRMLKRQ